MSYKNKLIYVFMGMLFMNLQAQQNIIEIWDNEIPGEVTSDGYQEELNVENGQILRAEKVIVPTLTVYKPKKPNGTTVIIFPGGGYHHLAIDKEGTKVAQWLNQLGITAFVLKYCLPSDVIMEDKTIGPLQDAQRAVRYVRRNAEKMKLDPAKIGVMGFSAGGHLAATLSTQYDTIVYELEDEVSAQPNFSILVYPVISMQDDITHQGSKTNLLGDHPSEEQVMAYSNEKQVTDATPKTFLVHATDDSSVPVENSIRYYMALKSHNVPVELHLYEKGGHGFGLGRGDTNQYWPLACEQWLDAHHLINKTF
ncbi:alpha/beta hydrolase [Sediminibacter sp. Hel_I_10]|uniref:alpha/beta hydrolase n=1 Tax=Sediminibacter sp. Hel_I_10 TaxID=1392490 RepID=UPI0009DCF047|nr:alpha/beta hydrolase [Sediminibacter sp. Hel_I_10]